MNAPLVLKTENLSIGYGKSGRARVVASGLDLAVPEGEFVCLIGPNGAGKSTLLKTLAGIHEAISGKILLMGRDLRSISPSERARILGVVLTERVDMEGFSAFDVVALGRYFHTDWRGVLGESDTEKVLSSLEMVGGSDLCDRRINELSDGERQKVMIARALAQEPRLIFLDEPTSFLDLLHKVEILGIMRQLTRKQGKTIVMAIHDIPLALQYADRLWLLDPSGTLYDGAPEDLALSGKIAETFSSGAMVFDPWTGTYPFGGDGRPGIVLAGRGDAVRWTERALIREGFSVEKTGTGRGLPLLSVTDNGSATSWDLRTDDADETYSNIYDMVKGLRRLLT